MLRGIVSVLPSLSAPGACPSGGPDAGTRARRGSRERGLSGDAASDGGLPAGSSGGIPGLLRRRRYATFHRAGRAGDLRREILKLDEGVGLAAQLVGHHRRGGAQRGGPR